ncbi:MAG: molybdenum cofactor guanylyltransferase [Bacteroidota bacterium]
MRTDLAGLVFIGGKSSRMGKDKAFLPFKGKPLFEWAYEKLNPFCEEVYLSVNESQFNRLKGPFSFSLIQDATPAAGPMAALIQSLAQIQTSLLVLPVDAPLISPQTVQEIISSRDPNALATLFYEPKAERWEPLIGIWEHKALTDLTAYQQNGGKSFQKFLQHHSAKKVVAKRPSEFLNVNDPAAYDDLS